jgi:hypothetical protein
MFYGQQSNEGAALPSGNVGDYSTFLLLVNCILTPVILRSIDVPPNAVIRIKRET